MTSVGAGSTVFLLVGVLACPLMLTGIGQTTATCAETGDSHEPMSDTRMSCCSSATDLPRLAPTDSYSSRDLKIWSVALLHAGARTQPRSHRRAIRCECAHQNG